jgi:hypothetical protein
MREGRFMVPWNVTSGDIWEKPLAKLEMAGVVRVPPAPWVKIRWVEEDVEEE